LILEDTADRRPDPALAARRAAYAPRLNVAVVSATRPIVWLNSVADSSRVNGRRTTAELDATADAPRL
jgi:hypothetical protein